MNIGLHITDDGLGIDLTASADVDQLLTSVLISIYTEARVTLAELPEHMRTDDPYLGGWFGDDYTDAPGDNIGSKSWMARHMPANQDTADKVRDWDTRALRWMIDDGVASVVEVIAEPIKEPPGIARQITIHQPDAQPKTYPLKVLWEATSGAQ